MEARVEKQEYLEVKQSAQSRSLILGLGRSGLALARYFEGKSQAFYVFDDRGEAAFTAQMLVWTHATWWHAGADREAFCAVTELLVSPGVPPTHPLVVLARELTLPIIGELEIAASQTKLPLFAITGTNGKSTTVALLSHFLESAGYRAPACGNFGVPVLDILCDASDAQKNNAPLDALVVEVSSFQAETSPSFKPKYAALLNLTSDHLDRYPSMDAYLAAKACMVVNQDENDVLVVNAEELAFLNLAKRSRARVFPFSSGKRLPQGAFIVGETLFIRNQGKEERMSLRHNPLMGLHHLENILAAVSLAFLFGVPLSLLEAALATFKGLPHRLVCIAEKDGVRFYDDSKGTNVGALAMSLASFDDKIVLIAGGRDKNGDFASLAPLVKAKVDAVFLIGEAASTIRAAWQSIVKDVEMVDAETMDRAVPLAFKRARLSKYPVVLSPACASFDQFRDYHHRGDVFQQNVERL